MAKPVIMQSSLKFWNKELLFVKGLDLAYMPYIVMSEKTEDFRPPILKDDALHHIFKFCECLGVQFTWDTFMKLKILYTHGCKFLVFQSGLIYLLSFALYFLLSS